MLTLPRTGTRILVYTIAALALGCGGPAEPPTAPTASTASTAPPPPTTSAPAASTAPPLALPSQLAGKAVLVAKGDPDEPRADLAGGVKPPGEGALVQGLVVRLTEDVRVWRLWSGPARKDAGGRTNRLGQWWAYDAPRGTQQQYRVAYEICASWNDLTWVARCTLKKGSVVAIGPGNSVSSKTCGDAAGKEAYPVNRRDWQVWISKVWTRTPQELDCPPETGDYEADPAEISRPKGAKN